MCMSLTRARGLCSCSSSTRRTSISSPTTSWTVRLQSRRGRRRRKWGQFELVAAGDPREVREETWLDLLATTGRCSMSPPLVPCALLGCLNFQFGTLSYEYFFD
uniref:Uncharacterized protein n=1 Tax=Triticum urartu TaxID=4572 RepID=A0A8R7V9Y5_TRIUA